MSQLAAQAYRSDSPKTSKPGAALAIAACEG
jgi:hypothetical protein